MRSIPVILVEMISTFWQRLWKHQHQPLFILQFISPWLNNYDKCDILKIYLLKNNSIKVKKKEMLWQLQLPALFIVQSYLFLALMLSLLSLAKKHAVNVALIVNLYDEKYEEFPVSFPDFCIKKVFKLWKVCNAVNSLLVLPSLLKCVWSWNELERVWPPEWPSKGPTGFIW